MTWAVRFENVSKLYRGSGVYYATLRDELARLGRKIAGRLHDRANPQTGVTALDHVSFVVEEGEAFALVGPNGAGKTTALRLLTRVSRPTNGRIRFRGRVAALIEAGSGIHPELTGRENIWLYSRIIGMPRRVIARRFDEIVDFAELAHVLDKPVKFYSTGMQLRLGFAIVSHMNPDILAIDEALAVGDAHFQAKCADRMNELVASGRTVIFVSHNLSVAEALCNRGLFLLDGRIAAIGRARETLRAYINWVDQGRQRGKGHPSRIHGRGLTVERVTLHPQGGDERYAFDTFEPVEARIHIHAEDNIEKAWVSLWINDGRPGALILCSMLEQMDGFNIPRGRHVIYCRLGPLPLRPRTYELGMSVRGCGGSADLLDAPCVATLRIRLPQGNAGIGAVTTPWLYAPICVDHRWTIESDGNGY